MDTFNKIINLYEEQLNIPHNEYCQLCDSQYKQPLLPWVVGRKYFSEKGGIFIGGKPHRRKPGTLRESGIIDGRIRGEHLFFNESWPYWSYTKDILNNIYGSPVESWDHIAFANVVKCTSTDSDDKTSRKCASQCIEKNEVIYKEIELLRPRKIIFFTWSMHRKIFAEIPFARKGSVTEHTNIDFRMKCGAKKLGWWDRTLTATWGNKVNFLILGHPERMKKAEYVSLVSQWLEKP